MNSDKMDQKLAQAYDLYLQRKRLYYIAKKVELDAHLLDYLMREKYDVRLRVDSDPRYNKKEQRKRRKKCDKCGNPPVEQGGVRELVRVRGKNLCANCANNSIDEDLKEIRDRCRQINHFGSVDRFHNSAVLGDGSTPARRYG
jgi:formylmethanofuran dehydrogenase subunit E